jgi:hypothetical protein
MIELLLNLFVGCSHQRTTFPFTPMRNSRPLFTSGLAESRTYVVCLDCAKELPYNWHKMSIEINSRLGTAAQQQPDQAPANSA